MNVLVVVFEQLYPLHLLDRLVLPHVVGVQSISFVVHWNEVLLKGLQAYLFITHQVLKHNLHLFFNHLGIIPIKVNLQTK